MCKDSKANMLDVPGGRVEIIVKANETVTIKGVITVDSEYSAGPLQDAIKHLDCACDKVFSGGLVREDTLDMLAKGIVDREVTINCNLQPGISKELSDRIVKEVVKNIKRDRGALNNPL